MLCFPSHKRVHHIQVLKLTNYWNTGIILVKGGAMRSIFVWLLVLFILVSGVAFGKENVERRDPLLYGLASFVIPGLGQFIQGDTNKALTHFLVDVAIGVAGGYLALFTPYAFVTPVIAAAHLVWALYSAMDSYEMAVAYNKEHGFAQAGSPLFVMVTK